MVTPTHASLAVFRMDLTRESEQREGLRRMIVPSVTSSPGFVSGTWTLDRERSESTVLVAFDSLANAESFVASVRANAPHQAAVGIELLTVRIVEVSASAELPIRGDGGRRTTILVEDLGRRCSGARRGSAGTSR